MGKKRSRKDDDSITETKLLWFLTTAYVLRAVGLLDKEKERKLDKMDEYGAGNWKDHVERQLGVKESFIRSVFSLCTEFKDRVQAVAFILRGFGCPCTEERLAEFSELR